MGTSDATNAGLTLLAIEGHKMIFPSFNLPPCGFCYPFCFVGYGRCHCGCGGHTSVSTCTSKTYGYVGGAPRKFIVGHNETKLHSIEFICMEDSYACRVSLGKGVYTITDVDYLYLFENKTWGVSGNVEHRRYVAHRQAGHNMVRIHRLIMGLSASDKREVDHINGNTLDNRKSNLRICLHSENVRNRRRNNVHTNGYKGTTFHKSKYKWQAQIGYQGKRIHLGYFDTQEEAYAAYCAAAVKYFGEFARIA